MSHVRDVEMFDCDLNKGEIVVQCMDTGDCTVVDSTHLIEAAVAGVHLLCRDWDRQDFPATMQCRSWEGETQTCEVSLVPIATRSY